jgi:hypothetical protein
MDEPLGPGASPDGPRGSFHGPHQVRHLQYITMWRCKWIYVYKQTISTIFQDFLGHSPAGRLPGDHAGHAPRDLRSDPLRSSLWNNGSGMGQKDCYGTALAGILASFETERDGCSDRTAAFRYGPDLGGQKILPVRAYLGEDLRPGLPERKEDAAKSTRKPPCFLPGPSRLQPANGSRSSLPAPLRCKKGRNLPADPGGRNTERGLPLSEERSSIRERKRDRPSYRKAAAAF